MSPRKTPDQRLMEQMVAAKTAVRKELAKNEAMHHAIANLLEALDDWFALWEPSSGQWDEALSQVIPFDEVDGMCPNCVTPWKCNGPHEPSGQVPHDTEGSNPDA